MHHLGSFQYFPYAKIRMSICKLKKKKNRKKENTAIFSVVDHSFVFINHRFIWWSMSIMYTKWKNLAVWCLRVQQLSISSLSTGQLLFVLHPPTDGYFFPGTWELSAAIHRFLHYNAKAWRLPLWEFHQEALNVLLNLRFW